MGRHQLVVDQRVKQISRFGIPDLANHVIGHAGDSLAIGRRHDFSNPSFMCDHMTTGQTLFDIPPDQAAVIAARH